MEVKYNHLWADAQGECHFDEAELVLQMQDFAPPAKPLHASPFLKTADTFFICTEKEWGGADPHPAPMRQIMVMLRGDMEVIASDGSSRRLTPGAITLVENTFGKGHSSYAYEDCVIFVAALAESLPAEAKNAKTQDPNTQELNTLTVVTPSGYSIKGLSLATVIEVVAKLEAMKR